MDDFTAALRSSVTTLAELRTYLQERGIDPDRPELDLQVQPHVLPVRIPRYYLDLIEWDNPRDPLRRQVLPTSDEQIVLSDDLLDPIGDGAHQPVPGIVHRYPDRALFLLTSACVVHCRFCFRREFIGTPALTLRLRAIPHLRVIRIHSRTPAILPQRLTRTFAELAREYAPLYLVVHVNHPREVTDTFVERIGLVVDRGIPVLSQTVLLRGVNDNAPTLASLFRKLVEARVKPYYLHQLDRAPGTNHFRVPIREGRQIMRQLRGHVSGLCQPTYILDIPGGHGKVPLDPEYVHADAEDLYEIVNYRSEQFTYHEPNQAV